MTLSTAAMIGLNLGAVIILSAVVLAFVVEAQHRIDANARRIAWVCAAITALCAYAPVNSALSLLGLIG